jgi:hypothetical protein
MFLHVRFTASGRCKNRYFAPGDKMFPGTPDGGYLSGVDISRPPHNLRRKGMVARHEDGATLSPYLTQHINRVG